jgi:hypothetical protein
MPSYIVEPTTNTWPPVTIPQATPSFPCYSFGRLAGYADAPTINTEYAEAIPADGTAGRQFAVRTVIQGADTQNSLAITWETEFPSAPATVEVHLEGALRDADSEYFQLAKSTVATGDVQTVNWGASKVNFIRVKVISSTGGTSPTIISKFVV